MTDEAIKALEIEAIEFEKHLFDKSAVIDVKFLCEENKILYFTPFYKPSITGGYGLPHLLAYSNGRFSETSPDTYFRLSL